MSNVEIRAEFARQDFDQEKILQAAFSYGVLTDSGRAGYRAPSDNSGN
jgi:hypothetical protein